MRGHACCMGASVKEVLLEVCMRLCTDEVKRKEERGSNKKVREIKM